MQSKNVGTLIVCAIVILIFSIGYLIVSSEQMNKPHIVISVSSSTAPFIKKLPFNIEPDVLEESKLPNVVIDPTTNYVAVTDSCGPHFQGECVRVRSGPGTSFPVVTQLRNGMVLRTDGVVEGDGITWYKVIFDEWLRYPERLKSNWYVAANFVTPVSDHDELLQGDMATSSSKRIVVDRSDQTLTAYNGSDIFMISSISTGLELTPTPRGEFTIFKKTPSRYMQGPLPYLASNQYYDLPGVPWNLYFTEAGAVIHGAYWHESFGKPYSHGCVNMTPTEAEKLYHWAEVGTKILVRD